MPNLLRSSILLSLSCAPTKLKYLDEMVNFILWIWIWMDYPEVQRRYTSARHKNICKKIGQYGFSHFRSYSFYVGT